MREKKKENNRYKQLTEFEYRSLPIFEIQEFEHKAKQRANEFSRNRKLRNILEK